MSKILFACPSCGSSLINSGDDVCPVCGEEIDFFDCTYGEEDEAYEEEDIY